MEMKLKDYVDTGFTILDTFKAGPKGKGSFIIDERTLKLIQSEKTITKLNINRGKEVEFIEYEDIDETFFTYDFLTKSNSYKKYMSQLGYKFQKDIVSLDNYNPIFIYDKLIQFRTDNEKYGNKYYGLIVYKNSKIFHDINSWKYNNKNEEAIRFLTTQDSAKDFSFIEKVFKEDFGDNYYYEDIDNNSSGNNIMKDILSNKPFYKELFFNELDKASSFHSYKFFYANNKRIKKYVRMIPCGILFLDKNILSEDG